MKRICSFLFCIGFFLQIGAVESTALSQGTLEYFEHYLPSDGELCMAPNGFVFIKVDDEYVHKCIDEVSQIGFTRPPYFGEIYDCGAHISVIYNQELKGPLDVSELGEKIPFQIKGSQIWDSPHSKVGDKVWVILVEAPQLEKLREKYGLSKQFDFHITIGVKPRGIS